MKKVIKILRTILKYITILPAILDAVEKAHDKK